MEAKSSHGLLFDRRRAGAGFRDRGIDWDFLDDRDKAKRLRSELEQRVADLRRMRHGQEAEALERIIAGMIEAARSASDAGADAAGLEERMERHDDEILALERDLKEIDHMVEGYQDASQCTGLQPGGEGTLGA